MSNRYTPLSGDDRYPPRDRSPVGRYGERSASGSYTQSSGGRGGFTGARHATDPASYGLSGPFGKERPAREPPKAPKALADTSRPPPLSGANTYVPPTPRGRGYRGGSRDQSRERDIRDSGPPRQRDRDFDRERRLSPPSRARTPPLRDARSSREFSRDAEISRARRESRDGPLSAGSGPPDLSIGGPGPPGRGGFGRGRGRGGSDYRGRGRGGFVGDRESFPVRGLSRERRWDRERDTFDRDRDRDFDRRDDRREESKRFEREEREREAEKWKNRLTDPADGRTSAELMTPINTQFPPSNEFSYNRQYPPQERERGRDYDIPDRTYARSGPVREKAGSRQSSPPPQVPAFGSVSMRPTPGSIASSTTNDWRSASPPKSGGATAYGTQSSKYPPTGPKALAGAQPPTAPRAERMIGGSNVDPNDSLMRSEFLRGKDDAGSLPLGRLSMSPSKPGLEENRWSHRSSSPHGPRPPPLASESLFPRHRPSITSPNSLNDSGASSIQPNQSPPPRSANYSASSAALGPVPTGPRAEKSSRGRGSSWQRGNALSTGRGGPPAGVIPAKRDWQGDERERDYFPKTSPDEQIQGPGPSAADVYLRQGANVSLKAKDQSGGADVRMRRGNVADVEMTDDVDVDENLAGSPSMNVSEDERSENNEDIIDRQEMIQEYKSQLSQQMANLEERIQRTSSAIAQELGIMLQISDIINNRSDELLDSEPADEDRPAPRNDNLSSTLVESKDEDMPPLEADSILREVSSNRVKTPPLDSLPFLKNGLQTPILELDICKENLAAHSKLGQTIMRTISRQRKAEAHQRELLRQQYMELYKPWRSYVEQLDEFEKTKKDEEAAQTTPVVQTPQASSGFAVEGRRGGKYSTELEFQRALKQSELEEAQRRAALSQQEREATIPDMLDLSSRQSDVFKDANQLIDGRIALAQFNFLPPPDDFTGEEQKVFMENYLSFPKKWGKIAEGFPDRSYQECIQHYYATKVEAKYKQKEMKRNSRRGRGRRIANQMRPKANALMSDLGVQPELFDGDDMDTPPVAVTDSGRPRRAAAPVFGDTAGESDGAGSGNQSGRKPASSLKGDGFEAGSEKSSKRNKTTGKDRTHKRGRGLTATGTSSQSPHKFDKPIESTERDIQPQDDMKLKDLEGAQLLADLQSGSGVPPDSSGQAPLADERNALQGSTRSPPRTSSYWSVPESNEFPKLLDYFGTDWVAIANHMTSKTSIMVKNFYKREIEHHGRTQWRERAEMATERNLRNLPRGPMPAQTILPKRRYEGNQTGNPRSLSHNAEVAVNVAGPSTFFEPNASTRTVTKPQSAVPFIPGPEHIEVIPSSTGRVMSSASVQAQMDGLSVQSRPQALPSGPQRGFFSETRPESRSILASGQPLSVQQQAPTQVSPVMRGAGRPQPPGPTYQASPPSAVIPEPPSRIQHPPVQVVERQEPLFSIPKTREAPPPQARPRTDRVQEAPIVPSYREQPRAQWQPEQPPAVMPSQRMAMNQENAHLQAQREYHAREQMEIENRDRELLHRLERQHERRTQIAQAEIDLRNTPKRQLAPDHQLRHDMQDGQQRSPPETRQAYNLYEQRSTGAPLSHSPSLNRPLRPLSSSNDQAPSSTPVRGSSSPATRTSEPSVRKTSNIMSLLNSTDGEDSKSRATRPGSTSTPPPGNSPAHLAPPSSAPPTRREPVSETYGYQQHYRRESGGASYSSGPQAPMPSMTPDPSGSGHWSQHGAYPQRQASPPLAQQAYPQPGRSQYQQSPRTDSPVQYQHSRGPSYSERHPSLIPQHPSQPPSQQQMPPLSSQQQSHSSPHLYGSQPLQASHTPGPREHAQHARAHHQSPLASSHGMVNQPAPPRPPPPPSHTYSPAAQQHMSTSRYSSPHQSHQPYAPPPQPAGATQRSYTPTGQYAQHSTVHRLSGGPYDPPSRHTPPPAQLQPPAPLPPPTATTQSSRGYDPLREQRR